MLLGNWDGGMFPGQPCRQRAIVHCSPRAPQSTPEQPSSPGRASTQQPSPGPRRWHRMVAEGTHLQDTSTAARV